MENPINSEILSSLQNVYLLAKDRIKDGEEIEDIEGQDWYKREERKLEEAIKKGRLKPDPNAFFVMTINMNGKNTGQGTAKNRKLLLTIILRNFYSSLILSQEQSNKLVKYIENSWQLKAKKNEKEAAVFWNGSDFEGTDDELKSTDTRIIRIRDKVKNKFNVSEVLPRIKMVKLTQKPKEGTGNESFLAVSWHGPHRSMSKSEKRKVFEGLVEFVKEVSKDNGNIPFIIGGDFNLDTTDEQLPLSQGVAVPGYKLSPRSQKNSEKTKNYISFKDNFIFFGHGICVRWVSPIDFTSGSEQTNTASDLSEKQQEERDSMSFDRSGATVDDLLDHDPVVGVLELSSSTSPVSQNLNEKFKAASLDGQESTNI